jgi:hypothetical protein
MAFLLARNARVEEDLVDQLFNSSETSGEGTLLTANFGKEGKPERVITKDQPSDARRNCQHYALASGHLHE